MSAATREPEEVVTRESEIRGVRTRLRKVYVEGHLIEISLCYRISDAESVYGKAWDESLDKYLRDRVGRRLTYDEAERYVRMAAALRDTVRLMGEADAAIAANGGLWSERAG